MHLRSNTNGVKAVTAAMVTFLALGSGCSSNIKGVDNHNDGGPADAHNPDGATDRPDGTVEDATLSDSTARSDASEPDGNAPPCSELVYEQTGHVLTVAQGSSDWSVTPLVPGEGFWCMRVEFDLQTADCIQEILNMGGCPTFLGIAAIRGTQRQMAGGLFRVYRVQPCRPGPHRMQVDTFWNSDVVQVPWQFDQTYQVTLEVQPFTSTFTMRQGGAVVGTVSVDITGATVADTVDTQVGLGMTQPAQSAYFPMYGAVYSNIRIWASRAGP